MKFLLLALAAVTLCHAELFNDLPEKRFRQKSSQIINDIVNTIENELGHFIHKDLNEKDIKFIHQLSRTFATIIFKEVQNAIEEVEKIGALSREFTENMFMHLNMAASTIAGGLHLSREAAHQFIVNIMKDLGKLEASGLFHYDFNKIFDTIIHVVIAEVEYTATMNPNDNTVFHELNDTLTRIVVSLHDKYHNLHDFFLHILTKTAGKVRPHIDNIKTLANDLLSHVTIINREVTRQALDFFRPFNRQLGKTWIELRDRIHHRIEVMLKHRNPCPTPQPVARDY